MENMIYWSKRGLGDLDMVRARCSYFPAIPLIAIFGSATIPTRGSLLCCQDGDCNWMSVKGLSKTEQKASAILWRRLYQFRHGLWSEMTLRGFFLYGGSLSFEIPRTTCKS